jgi:hypothetical protein
VTTVTLTRWDRVVHRLLGRYPKGTQRRIATAWEDTDYRYLVDVLAAYERLHPDRWLVETGYLGPSRLRGLEDCGWDRADVDVAMRAIDPTWHLDARDAK